MSQQGYPGSHWWKFDFHNHTPASSDFDAAEIGTLQARDWLLAYMRKGIDCVALTDHNSSGWLEKLQTALRDMATEAPAPLGFRPLVLFPGVEITTCDSLHVLALFRPEEDKSVLDGLLIGKLTISNPGKPTAELMVSESASTVIDQIHALNGLAIAAHVERDNGLLQGSVDAAGAFRPNKPGRLIDDVLPKLDGLEFQSLDNDCYRHFAARIGDKALVSGSDSPHSTANAGSRYTWVKMSTPSFDGLRLALLDPESALRRSDQKPDDPQPVPEQWIQSITLENMHLRRAGHGPLILRFHPACNAVIGGRGSGKSTVLECLRLGLARVSELEKLNKPNESSEIWRTFEGFQREYSQRDKPGMMLPETRISVEVVKGKEESSQRFKFVWGKRPNGRFSTQVMRWEGDWQETGLDEQQASELFPVKIFSQKQILALANNPQALLEHIDNAIRDQKKAWLEQFSERKAKLLSARLRVRTLKKELDKKPALELAYKEASRKARVFANANFGPLLKAHQRATQQQRVLDDFYQLLANDIAELQAGIEQAANLASTELAQFLAETPAEIAARDHAIALKSQLLRQYEHIVATVSAMQRELDVTQVNRADSAWHQENQVHIQAYQNEAARLKGEGINSAQDAATAVATEERLREQLDQIKKFETDLGHAESAVELAVEELTECREALTQARKAFIAQLLEQNDMLRVSLRSMANARDGVGELRQILKLPDSAKFEDIWFEGEAGETSGFLSDLVDPDQTSASSVGERLHGMKRDIEGKSKKILRTTLHATLVKRLEALNEEAFDELSWWFPDDEVTLAYRSVKGAAYKNINLASAGQKTAAMLSFLLVHGDEPLLLDQPEDDLDNALVSELVVEQLRKNKMHRQLLVVTHNANIVVNADAELVMTMDFNGQITLASAGGLQETAVRQDICRVMEGGEEAFRQRYKRILEDLAVRP
jgi:energy-coupling factor transporter ATP-binding protein EcfA2